MKKLQPKNSVKKLYTETLRETLLNALVSLIRNSVIGLHIKEDPEIPDFENGEDYYVDVALSDYPFTFNETVEDPYVDNSYRDEERQADEIHVGADNNVYLVHDDSEKNITDLTLEELFCFCESLEKLCIDKKVSFPYPLVKKFIDKAKGTVSLY